MRWIGEPLYHSGTPVVFTPAEPVQRARKLEMKESVSFLRLRRDPHSSEQLCMVGKSSVGQTTSKSTHFSAVLGTASANSSNTTRPTACPSTLKSMNTRGLGIVYENAL